MTCTKFLLRLLLLGAILELRRLFHIRKGSCPVGLEGIRVRNDRCYSLPVITCIERNQRNRPRGSWTNLDAKLMNLEKLKTDYLETYEKALADRASQSETVF